MQYRQYQIDSIKSLRNGFRDGHVRQVLAAPTGAGKSVIMLNMIQKAVEKGSRVIFICERRILVEQFSKHLDAAGIAHGVLMAKHWRFRPQELVQVASAQTLEKMESLPAFDICFIDELHAAMRQSIINMINTRPTLKIVGASATPFHPKIAEHFSKVTSVTTMRELVGEGFLVPFRVFVAHEIDTRGLKVVAGEWKKDDLEKRGQQIVGDVVADYVRISNEVYGGYRKTICFSCGIAHGADLAKKFNEAGINAVQISSNDDDEYKAEVLADFARPDTDIKVVISVAILSRGFDQSDVDYVILARPLKKSFSEHVQMIGRGARIHPEKKFCIAKGSLVLTDSGLIPIEHVTLDNRVWDGVKFVTHGGAICQGVQEVMEYDGLIATPEHEVMTNDGWKTLKEAARWKKRIVVTGVGWKPIRFSKDIFKLNQRHGDEFKSTSSMSRLQDFIFYSLSSFNTAPTKENLHNLHTTSGRQRETKPQSLWGKIWFSCYLFRRSIWVGIKSKSECQMRQVWWRKFSSLPQHSQERQDRVLHALQSTKRLSWAEVAVSSLSRAAKPMYESIKLSLLGLWRAWDQILFPLCSGSDNLGVQQFRTTTKQAVSTRPNKQQWTLRNWKLAMGYSIVKYEQYKSIWHARKIFRVQDFTSTHNLCGQNLGTFIKEAFFSRSDRKVSQAIKQTEREVWDILNAGNLQRFTVSGKLVHNCVIQDNSGNFLRFKESWDELYSAGVTELTGEQDKKSRKELSEKEKKESKCPKCSVVWQGDICTNCGHVRERLSDVVAVPGEMSELGSGKVEKFSPEFKEAWYQSMLGHLKSLNKNEGRAYFLYKEKFGVYPKWKKEYLPATPEVIGYFTKANIAYSYRKKA